MRRTSERRHGFTLIEILIVVIILGILAMVLIPQIGASTDDARINLPPEQRGYQSVLRSCATVAYYSVLVAVNRLGERGLDDGVHPDELDDVHLGGDEPWMREVAHADLGGLFARAPAALRWLRAHPHAVPGEIPERLERAGLVDRVPGEEREVRYSASGANPYR